jgi:plastocyanin
VKKFAITLATLLMVGLLVLAACGMSSSTGGSSGTTSTSSSNTVTLGQTNFDQNSVTVKAGTALTFDDTNGGFHVLCLGHDQQCDSSTTGPKDLEGSGFMINPGQKHMVTFDTPGTYQITCSIHPNMNLTVIVQ